MKTASSGGCAPMTPQQALELEVERDRNTMREMACLNGGGQWHSVVMSTGAGYRNAGGPRIRIQPVWVIR